MSAATRASAVREQVDCCFSLGRVLLLGVTDACNQRCLHCMRSAQVMSAEPLDLALLERALRGSVERLAPARIVISGGEPTLVPNLVGLVALIDRLGVPASVCTNAVRVDARLARRLAGAGLRAATVSLDGLDEGYAWFRGSSGYERAMRGISAIADAGIRTTVNITLHDLILDQADAFARRLGGLGLGSVSVTSPIAQGRAAGGAALYGRVTEGAVRAFADRLARGIDHPVSLRVPRCDRSSCPSGRTVFSMDRRGVVAGCPDVGATNVCDRNATGGRA